MMRSSIGQGRESKFPRARSATPNRNASRRGGSWKAGAEDVAVVVDAGDAMPAAIRPAEEGGKKDSGVRKEPTSRTGNERPERVEGRAAGEMSTSGSN